MTVENFVKKFFPKARTNRGGWLVCCPYPDHADDTPSFSISGEGLFYCWGCKKKGNYAKLLHDVAGWSWHKSITYADSLISMSSNPFGNKEPFEEGEEPALLSRGLLGLYDCDWEQGWVRFNLAQQEGDTHIPPWAFPFTRDFRPVTLRRFNAGYNQDDQRITIPVFNDEGLQGFIGRATGPSDFKYLVYPPLKPSHNVYNLEAIETGENVIICEGAFDVWTLWQYAEFHGPGRLRNAVALLTSRVSEEQLRLLVSRHSRFTIMFDQDKGGRQGAMQVASNLLTLGCIVDIAMNFPKGKEDLKSLSYVELIEVLRGRRPYPAASSTEMLRRSS